MKCYFIRHGKTLWNQEGRFQGSTEDSPLLDDAKEEIRQLGQALSHIPFDAVYSSDQKRAVDTTHIIVDEAGIDADVIYTDKLREWKLGKLEGAKITTMSAIYPTQISAFHHNLAKFNTSQFDAESTYQTTQRVAELIHSLKDSDYENVLIVGHGANLTASIRHLLGFEPALFRSLGGLANASLTILETMDFNHFECLKWNDKSYLEDTHVLSHKT
ncbi:histidine phosphatase family protein [Streptococcus phocae subsp. salmonis]|uniref:histidine phosphatase family protein n=1 Tax=Streptococcus phocae TaxID=119224 RepID=UPI00053212D8|nr:histidine phosphatase family protein [Streptococcus phocae]KGR73244.1 phosphoglycerate mutase [Streptococcus phocae subsp. salmonis]